MGSDFWDREFIPIWQLQIVEAKKIDNYAQLRLMVETIASCFQRPIDWETCQRPSQLKSIATYSHENPKAFNSGIHDTR